MFFWLRYIRVHVRKVSSCTTRYVYVYGVIKRARVTIPHLCFVYIIYCMYMVIRLNPVRRKFKK
jgi:hypothetical protein